MAQGGLRIGVAKKLDPIQGIKDAVEAAKKADVVVLAVATGPEYEAESFDRPHMKLPGDSDKLIAAVLEANPNTVVVIQSGTPVELPWISKAPTVLEGWFGGNSVGDAIAGVIFGKTNPSGKLSLSWPNKLADNPSYGNFPGENGKIRYGEGLMVGYRHYDFTEKETLFSFGHGLSYTHFKYEGLSLSSSSFASPKAIIKATVSLANTGSLAGSESCQLYISPAFSPKLQRPLKELKGFGKVNLKPGESGKIEIEIGVESLGYYDDTKSVWVAEKGEYHVLIGASSTDIRLIGVIKNEQEVEWTGLGI